MDFLPALGRGYGWTIKTKQIPKPISISKTQAGYI